MADFKATVKALNNGGHVRRNEWGEGSTMCANQDGQLTRVGPDGNTYGWMLDLNDINATDWQTVEPTSIHRLNHNQLC
jgi:hypothetical protein